MSIPDLRFDNPLDVRQLPDEPLITKLPALGRPQPLGSLYTWANAQSAVVAVVFVQSLLTFFAGYAGATTWVLSDWLALLFAGAIVARARFQYPLYTWIVILLAAPTLATNVSMAVHRIPSGELRLIIGNQHHRIHPVHRADLVEIRKPALRRQIGRWDDLD